MLRIIFFEDYPNASENRLFRQRLRRELRGIELQTAEIRSVSTFEDYVSNNEYDMVILDIMAQAHDGFKWTDTDDEVTSSLTGVELLRRCRLGRYGERYRTCPVYMRTARGEARIQEMCRREGATRFYQAGAEDSQLIADIQKTYSSIQAVTT